jgi:hypothetical protein
VPCAGRELGTFLPVHILAARCPTASPNDVCSDGWLDLSVRSAGDCRVLESPRPLLQVGRQAPKGRAAVRAAGNGKDTVSASSCRRGWGAILLQGRLRV